MLNNEPMHCILPHNHNVLVTHVRFVFFLNLNSFVWEVNERRGEGKVTC